MFVVENKIAPVLTLCSKVCTNLTHHQPYDDLKIRARLQDFMRKYGC